MLEEPGTPDLTLAVADHLHQAISSVTDAIDQVRQAIEQAAVEPTKGSQATVHKLDNTIMRLSVLANQIDREAELYLVLTKQRADQQRRSPNTKIRSNAEEILRLPGVQNAGRRMNRGGRG